MRKRLEYGSVLFTAGKYKGKTGYYDDDDGKYAIVYLEAPFVGKYVYCLKSSIENISLISHERWKKNNSSICEAMGVY